jgi:hypothetical protein
MKENKKHIFIRYSANPNLPNSLCHKDTNISSLTKARTRKFEVEKYQEAFTFLMECTSPITKIEKILWAFPDKERFKVLRNLDELKELKIK